MFSDVRRRDRRLYLRQLTVPRVIRRHWFQLGLGLAAAAAVVTGGLFIYSYNQEVAARAHLTPKTLSLVGGTSTANSAKLAFDEKKNVYDYNPGYKPSEQLAGVSSGPKFSARIPADPAKEVTITDPATGNVLGFTPGFEMSEANRQDNHLVYPLAGRNASKVFTLGVDNLKEDIILHSFQGEEASFTYTLKLPDNTEARLDSNGSVGIYGANEVLLGNVTAATDQDAQLLEKARQKSSKNTLLFSIPAPFVRDMRGLNTQVRTKWQLVGSELTLLASDLDKGVYPLTLDPSVFITSASEFMAGNNESNVDFDTSNELIQKGRLTGGRINRWKPVAGTQDLPTALWGQATVVAGGYIYVIGGSTGVATAAVGTVYWAKLDPTTYNIVSPDPGNGTCTLWCTSTNYNLPSGAVRRGLSAAAYNGYLYAVGGFDATPTRTATVYYSKLGANGEPNTWATGTSLGGAGNERANASLVAYSNKLYLLGGQSNATTTGVTGAGSSRYAQVNPDGTLGSWTNTTTAMPNALWGHTALEYNGYIYLVGGINGTTTQNTVKYMPVGAAGDLTSSWTTTSAFTTARGTLGGSIASIWGGYMYVTGGCTTVTATDCTSYATGTASQSGVTITGTGFTPAMVGMVMTFANGITAQITAYTSATVLMADNDEQTVASQSYTLDLNDQAVQLASINPDGSVSAWRTIALDAGTYYMTGTAAESTTNDVITGTGTAWTIDNIGDTISFANAVTDVVKGWVSGTSIIGTNSTTVSNRAYTLTNGVYYTNGTVTQSGTTITATAALGTVFTADMIGKTITIADGGLNTPEIITGATSTTLTVGASFSKTIGTASVYVIRDTHPRAFSFGFAAWRGTLYDIGGCAAMNGSGGCTAVSPENEYGPINTDGNVSQKRAETTLPTAGTSNTAGTVGRWSNGVVINNGYIYTVGGCGASPCTTSGNANANLAYAAIGSDGGIVPNGVTGCAGGATTWCVVQVNLNGTVGLAAFGIAVYNNTIYVGGGSNLTASGYQNDYYYLALNATTGAPVGTFASAAGTTAAGGSINTLGGNQGYPYMFARANNATTGYLYTIGGCTGTSLGVGCNAYVATVYRCQISHATKLVGECLTTGQEQLPTGHGIAISSNSVYGKYIYMCGGADGTGAAQTDTCYYAQFDSSNNIVPPTRSPAATDWLTTTARLPEVRRRGTGFAANGYMYVIGGHDGTTGFGSAGSTLHDVVYAKIRMDNGDLVGTANTALFDTSTTTVSGRWNLGTAVANGYFYAVGGCTSGAPPTSCTSGTGGMSGVVESVQVYNNYSGSPLAYSTAANNIGADSIGGRTVINNGYIYYAGGCDNLTCSATHDFATVYYAPLSASGDIGTWNTTTSMGTKRAYFGLTAYRGYMYALGGSNAATVALATTEKAFICDGTATGGCTAGGGNIGKLGTWSADTSMGVGNERADFGFAQFNGYVYIVGGINNTSVLQNTVFHALLGTGSIGAWTTNDTTFTTARSGATLAAYGSALYLLGGYDGTNYLLDTQYVNIITNASDGTVGTIGSWIPGTPLPQAVRQGSGYAANGYLYLFGGRSAASTCTTNTYVAPINGYFTIDTTGLTPAGFTAAANRVSRSGIGQWSQTVVAYNDARFGLTAVYGSGKTYLLGGGCSAMVGTGTGVTANRAFYSTLQTQPQIANYSISIDEDTDVFPAKYLMNGIDNGTGAQWTLNYQSSNNVTHTWGTNTNAGALTLGTPGTYTYFDTLTGERWYYLNLTVDASQAFGFPEDVTRGPTITDITLETTTDPGKRLHHGKTFTGGLLQPLDAPF